MLTFPNTPDANVPPGVPVLTARPVTPAVAEHGEGPVWHPSFDGVRWVDMQAGDILELAGTEDVRRTHVGTVAACFRPRRDGGIVLADQRGFVLLDEAMQVERRLPDVWDDPGIRMNEGAADPAGNFWAGSMAYDQTPGAGALYRLAPDLSVEKVLDGVTVSNGFGFSPDGVRAYYVDTPTRKIDVFDHRGGTLSGRRTALRIVEGPGSPDGLTVDAEGCVWVAAWDGGAVRRWTPAGELDRTVEVPAARTTACAFGGADLGDIYITTATTGLDPDRLAEQPLAGSVFVLPGAGPGLPGHAFAG